MNYIYGWYFIYETDRIQTYPNSQIDSGFLDIAEALRNSYE